MPQDRITPSNTGLSPRAAPLAGERSAGLYGITMERAR